MINFESPGRTSPELGFSGVIIDRILEESFGVFWLQLLNGLHHSQWAWSLDDKQKQHIETIPQSISELYELYL